MSDNRWYPYLDAREDPRERTDDDEEHKAAQELLRAIHGGGPIPDAGGSHSPDVIEARVLRAVLTEVVRLEAHDPITYDLDFPLELYIKIAGRAIQRAKQLMAGAG